MGRLRSPELRQSPWTGAAEKVKRKGISHNGEAGGRAGASSSGPDSHGVPATTAAGLPHPKPNAANWAPLPDGDKLLCKHSHFLVAGHPWLSGVLPCPSQSNPGGGEGIEGRHSILPTAAVSFTCTGLGRQCPLPLYTAHTQGGCGRMEPIHLICPLGSNQDPGIRSLCPHKGIFS